MQIPCLAMRGAAASQGVALRHLEEELDDVREDAPDLAGDTEDRNPEM